MTTADTAATPKARERKTTPTGRRLGTIGATIEEMLIRSAKRKRPMKYSEVLEQVHSRHPGAKTSAESVDYYAWNLRKRHGIEPNLDRKH